MSQTHGSNSRRNPDTAVDELKEAAVELGGNMRDLGGHLRDAAKEQVDTLRERAHDYVEQGRKKAMGWEKELESYVEERPLKALLIAAGAGILIGYLWRRR
jgi:ElaB/YqjD/DUF883 family membrane-anchored ribosome-binding protein